MFEYPNLEDDAGAYIVVINERQQYSIWPDGKELPAGWQPAGKTGKKSECLDYISTVWVDMRPLSLRRPENRT